MCVLGSIMRCMCMFYCVNLYCRDISSVCGFTREVLTALIANIETREWRRCEIAVIDMQP